MFKRFRSRRVNEETRLKYRETFLKKKDFIWPVFVVEGEKIKKEITSMPDVFHYSIDSLIDEIKNLNGLRSILLFGVPEIKGIEQTYDKNGIVQRAVGIIKKEFPMLEVITDVCLCSYTEDGHCHIGDNDKTCEVLAKIAVSHAQASADIVAPSDMMDGRVYYIKKAFKENNINNTKILSYAAKYASNFYGPFRDAAKCDPKMGDRKAYQMDYANSSEAIEEIEADIGEGADQIMIKPALSYLDIIANAKRQFDVPIVAYNVSLEYKALISVVKSGWCNEDIINETLVSIKRAGADRIVSYFTPYILKGLTP